MKREIKFRAWDATTSDPKMVSWDDLKSSPCEYVFIHNKDVTLMQFTGLKDKTGMDIYEGDIIEDDGVWLTINWSDEDACYWANVINGSETYSLNEIATESFVQGNIHENPDIINKLSDKNGIEANMSDKMCRE